MLKSNLLLCAGTYELHMKLRNHDQLDWKYQIKDVTHQTVRSKHYIFSYPKIFTVPILQQQTIQAISREEFETSSATRSFQQSVC